ncbi:PiggyBac-like protein (macronuclear) [Tetrahymena thermophila SB210]|uniref:PiggyBac-like protein n=2 Tax=Tetrahymena thermophila TaxID=5911 RepID=W7XIA7_TETTS|nr:PiggyBac-like protein [Tetrahymena thermophila SB210]EWS73134.1 PiggyBac-like protein [Tetrahymena thermophila SB210]|eukprot:XP_012654321.1 PiggyBac-like protein [Tetrahymena thermophila SB210]
MKNLREDSVTDWKDNQNIEFLIKLKNQISKKNIQFLTSEEALQISLRIKPKQILQRPKYNGTFQIRNELTADVVVFTKTLEKHLLNLKTYSNITEWNPSTQRQMVEQQIQYYQVDDILLENPVQDISKYYKYGNQLVKMSELFLNQINLFTLKEIKLIGSVQKSSIPRQSFMSGCDILFAKQDSKRSRYIIASLIKACFEEQRYLVARFVLRQNSIPKLVVLIPHLKKNCEYFYIIELPTVESIRDYSFNSLIRSTPEQQKLMSQLIDELDLDQDEKNQNQFKIGSQPNETIAKINDLILMRGMNVNEEEINKKLFTKEYQQTFKSASQKLLSNINEQFNLKIINQQLYHDSFNQKIYWKNLISQKDDKLFNDLKDIFGSIEKQNYKDLTKKAYQQIDFSMPQSKIISILSQPLFDIREFQEYIQIVQNLIYKTMDTFIKGYTSNIIIELILLIRNKSIQFEQYEAFNQFLLKFYEKFQNDQFISEIVSSEINLISTENHQNSVILTQIEEEFLRQNLLQKEMSSLRVSSKNQENICQNQTSKMKKILVNSLKNNQNNDEEIYYSDESETNQARRQKENDNSLPQDNHENQQNFNTQQQKKQNKQLVSFTQLSSYNSIYSESETSQHEDQIIQNNQDLNSSIEESGEEEQKQDLKRNKGNFSKKLNLNDVNFKLCSDNKLLKETLINIDLTYRKPQVKNIPLESTPVQIFQKLWSDEIWKLITDETNKYSKQSFDLNQYNLDSQSLKKQKICFFSQDQIKRFIICEILMGIQRLPSFSDYFSSDPLLSGGLNRILGRENYQLLTRYLHISDNQSRMVHVDDHTKFKQFQSILNRNYQQFYVPSNYLAIDEGIIPFKGKTKFKVYCPQKPVKFGIKEYLFCDYSGYTLNLIIHSPHEKQNIRDIYQPQTLQTQDIVNELIKDYQPLSGSILIMDNYYNSLNLIHDLNQQNIGVLGTVRPDRMNFTEEQKKMMKIQNFNKGETKSLTKDNIHIFLWRDKDKLVKMITNFLDNRKIVKSMKKTGQIKTIPLMVDIYNKYAHSVDKRNQICQNYRIHKRSQKWWKCVFYRLLDTTLCNAYIIYKILNEGKKSLLTHKDFRIKIVEELIQSLNESTAQLTKSLSHNRGIIYSLIDINKVRKQGVQQEIIAHFLERQNQVGLCSLCKQATFFTCESCNYGNKKIALCPVNCHKEHMKKVYNLIDK